MWANKLVSRSTPPFARYPGKALVGAVAGLDTDTLSKRWSSGENRGNKNSSGRGNRYGGRGQGGRGGGGRGGRGNENPRRNKKTNFSKEFLEPAARGELKNHQSTIPKLAGRKPKGHGVRGADVFPTDDDEVDFELEDTQTTEFLGSTKSSRGNNNYGTIAENSPLDQLSKEEFDEVQTFMQEYTALINSEEPEKYYWSEQDFDDAMEAEKAIIFEKLRSEATRDADGNLVIEVDDETFAMFDGIDPEDEKPVAEEPRAENTRSGPMSPADDPAFEFLTEKMNVKGADKPPPKDYDRVLPLQLQGPTIQDFVESMMNHPVKYGEIRWDAPNQGSAREPVAEIPPNRRNPPSQFVEANKRFIYVWGLPPLALDGEEFDIDNPLHCMEIQKQVGKLFEVDNEHVSVASHSSAFVGFPLVEDHKFAVAVGPKENYVVSPVSISRYTPDKDFHLAADHSDSLIVLENLPLGFTPSVLSTGLFPKGSDVGEVYGNIAADKIVMTSPNSAVIAMENAETADHAVSSSMVQERLADMGQHRVRYNKARRELVKSGQHGGPDGTEPLRTQGTQLIVDGDMPTKAFFISHSSALSLRNLDPTVTKEQIAEFFQPFCSVPRDVEGSVEFVTCREGLPTGRAYVGFDEAGELEAAVESLASSTGRISGLGPGTVIARRVRELDEQQRPQTRSARSEDELLDDLSNWEQHVDPDDLQELLDHGISKDALDEAFRTIRHNNTTFASMDQAMRSETLNPEKERGGMYKDLVQGYIAALKDCLSTPDDPGLIYESLFFPDEEIDTEIFDMEPERQEELRKRREVPWTK